MIYISFFFQVRNLNIRDRFFFYSLDSFFLFSLGQEFKISDSFCILLIHISLFSGQKFKLQSIEDGEFFLSAMKRCCNNLHDLELAYRIDKLLNTDNNIQLMVDSRLENVYYTFFLQLVCTFESLEKIMEVYQRVTPHIWTPNYSVLGELLKAMELQDGFKYLPLIWTDLLLFDFLRREELLEHLLYLMAKQKQEVFFLCLLSKHTHTVTHTCTHACTHIHLPVGMLTYTLCLFDTVLAKENILLI